MIPACILAIEDDSDRIFIESLYYQYNRLMYHEIFKITKDIDAIEDILQTTLVKLIDKIQKLRALDRNRLVNYIITSSKNSALNYLRDKNRHSKLSFDECIDHPDSEYDRYITEDHIIQFEEWALLRHAWPNLDERSRCLLEGRYLLDKTNEELAQELHVKPDSIRMALTRARKAAFQLLSEEVETKK